MSAERVRMEMLKLLLAGGAAASVLAMAEGGHGVAIIPSTLRAHRYRLRVVGVTYQGRPLREPLAIFWERQRPLPRYATAFCHMLAAHVREVFPITRPSEPTTDAMGTRLARRRAR